MAISLSVKDHAQSRQAQPGSAYYPVARQDWGVLAPGTTGTAFSAGANLTNVGSGGSLATSTGAFKITWVTQNGESLPSVEATVSVTGGPSGSVTVALGSVGSTNTGAQANAAAIIGWNVYSGNGSGNELRNATAAGLNGQALSTLNLPSGATLTYIPIAVTSVTVTVYGAGAAPPVLNTSGVQFALPNVSANGTSDVQIKVPIGFNIARMLQWARPNAVADAAGISLDAVDCVAPLWPISTSVSAGTFIVVNNNLFVCTVAGTTGAAPGPNWALAAAKYATIVDNGATWQNVGKFHVLTLRFSNASGSAAQPTANEYDFWQP